MYARPKYGLVPPVSPVSRPRRDAQLRYVKRILVVALVGLALVAANAQAAKLPDPRGCAIYASQPNGGSHCAKDAAVVLLKHAMSLRTGEGWDADITCLVKRVSGLRWRCSFRGGAYTGAAVISWTPAFKPSVTVLSELCDPYARNGDVLVLKGCTSKVPAPG